MFHKSFDIWVTVEDGKKLSIDKKIISYISLVDNF